MKLHFRMRPVVALMLVAGVLPALPRAAADEVPIVVDPEAQTAVRLAADELAGYLGRLYPQTHFSVQHELPPSGRAIRVGCVASDAALRARVDAERLRTPESCVVQMAADGNRQIGMVAGADERGTVYAVYGLLCIGSA